MCGRIWLSARIGLVSGVARAAGRFFGDVWSFLLMIFDDFLKLFGLFFVIFDDSDARRPSGKVPGGLRRVPGGLRRPLGARRASLMIVERNKTVRTASTRCIFDGFIQNKTVLSCYSVIFDELWRVFDF